MENKYSHFLKNEKKLLHLFLSKCFEGLDDKVISFLQVPFSEHDTQSNIFVKKIQNNILFHITIL